jgi:hypothetical protein
VYTGRVLQKYIAETILLIDHISATSVTSELQIPAFGRPVSIRKIAEIFNPNLQTSISVNSRIKDKDLCLKTLSSTVQTTSIDVKI